LRARPGGRAGPGPEGAAGDAAAADAAALQDGGQRQARAAARRRAPEHREGPGPRQGDGRRGRRGAENRRGGRMSAERIEDAGGAATQTAEAPSLLDQVIQATRPQNDKEADRAKGYFKQFLEGAVKPGQVVSRDAETNIKYWIGELDKKLSGQLNA